jgi:hypothetical protein
LRASSSSIAISTTASSSPAPATGTVALTARLRHEHGVIADAREPDIVRLAPVPLYSTYHDCWRAATALAATIQPVGNGQPVGTVAPGGGEDV